MQSMFTAAFAAALLAFFQADLTPEALRRLSDEDLVTTYENVTIAARPPHPHDASPSSLTRNPAYGRVKAEILHRGRGMAPHLSRALKAEVDAKRPDTADRMSSGLIYDEIKLLTEIGDPRAVETLLEILLTPVGPRESGPAQPHYEALLAIEKLTFVSFHRVEPQSLISHFSIEHASAVDSVNFSADTFPKAVQMYRDWLQGDGKDPAEWLPLAQKRARALLEGDNMRDAFCAAAFLSGPPARTFASPKRDDQPERTLERLAQIVGDARRVPDGDKFDYEYRGQRLTHFASWPGLMTAYGPRARPQASVLVRLQKEIGLINWSIIQRMAQVGGADILAYFFEVLPAINKEVEALRHESAVEDGAATENRRDNWTEAQRWCRIGIDRWAGRHFDSDEERFAWWADNKDKSPEQWLRDSLPIMVARADAHEVNSIRLFGELLPDSPFDNVNAPAIVALRGRRGPPPDPPAAVVERQKWFEQHRAELIYDANVGAFRLPNAEAR